MASEADLRFQGPPGDAVLESHAVEILHGDEGMAVLLADVVDGADVGVIESGGGLGLALKSCRGLRVPGDFVGKKFQRDKTARRVSSAL